ncbi:MAG: hypothetical protein RR316_00080 [Clostridia bacterium]
MSERKNNAPPNNISVLKVEKSGVMIINVIAELISNDIENI